MDYHWIRDIVLSAGANDVGIVEIDRKELSDQKEASCMPIAVGLAVF